MDIKAYCDANGVPYQETAKGLRVMDTSMLPAALRDGLDAKGYLPEKVETKAEPEAEEAEPEAPAKLRGHLPDDFPYYSFLEAGDVKTYAQLRKRIEAGTLTDIKGIGDERAAEITTAFEGAGE
jgi:hypothetical protein